MLKEFVALFDTPAFKAELRSVEFLVEIVLESTVIVTATAEKELTKSMTVEISWKKSTLERSWFLKNASLALRYLETDPFCQLWKAPLTIDTHAMKDGGIASTSLPL